MERLTSFDYLHDPLPHWLAELLRLRLPRRARSSAFALAIASAVLISCVGLQHERRARAERAWEAAQSGLAAASTRLAAERVSVANVKHLIAVDTEIRGFHASGYRRAQALAAFAARLPARSWLTALSPEQGRTIVGGRAESIAAIGELLRGLSSARFGDVVVQRVSRAERSAAGPLFEFTLAVERL